MEGIMERAVRHEFLHDAHVRGGERGPHQFNNVWVVEALQHVDLFLERFDVGGFFRERQAEDFHGHVLAPQHASEHDSESAFPDGLEEFQLRQVDV